MKGLAIESGGVHLRLSEVTVCALVEDNINHHLYALKVEWRGGDKYAVMHLGYCLGADGEWEYEPLPSDRTDDWLYLHRFDYDTALRLAVDAAPDVEVNGRKARDLATTAAGGAEGDKSNA